MDADHLDIYQNEKNLEKSFKAFASLVSNPHHRWIKDGLEVSGLSFGTATKADVRVQNIKIKNGNYVFDFHSTDQMLRNLQFGLPGTHNLMNATVAIAMALLSVGCDPNFQLQKRYQTFKGLTDDSAFEWRNHVY